MTKSQAHFLRQMNSRGKIRDPRYDFEKGQSKGLGGVLGGILGGGAMGVPSAPHFFSGVGVSDSPLSSASGALGSLPSLPSMPALSASSALEKSQSVEGGFNRYGLEHDQVFSCLNKLSTRGGSVSCSFRAAMLMSRGAQGRRAGDEKFQHGLTIFGCS